MNVSEELDLRGVPCPANAARAVLQISMMGSGEVLLLFVDQGEPLENVIRSLEVAGHSIRKREQEGAFWRVWVESS